MPADPRLTVAIPTFNGARHLAEALRSVLSQEGAAFDLVVSDDRSEDETEAIVRAEAGDRARWEVNSDRLGLAGNWNRCVARARTPLVAVFHQDDLMRPGHLAAHRSAFDALPDAGFIAGAAEVIDDQGRPVPGSVVGRGDLGPSDRTFPPGLFLAELAGPNPVRCSAVTLRAEAHRQVGGFDPSWRYAVDWEFWVRVARLFPVRWLARPTVAVRWHAASETHRFASGTDDLGEVALLLDRLHREVGPALTDPVRARRRADRWLARAFLGRAHLAARAGDRRLTRGALAAAIGRDPAILARVAVDLRLAGRLLATLFGVTPKGPRSRP